MSVETRRGSQTPRLQHRPLWVSSLGRDACDLAEHAGLVLDPWQADVLTESLGRRPSGKWSALEVALIVPRQNGKGAIIEARQLAAMFLTKDPLVIYSAHQFKTAKLMYRRISELCKNTPDLHKRVQAYRQSNEETGIELPWGRLQFFARSTGSGRGFTGNTNFFDEAFDLDGEMLADMLPTMAAAPNAQAWYVSSAGKRASTTLAGIRQRGIDGAALMLFLEWSAREGADLDSIEELLGANPGIGYHLDLEYILEVERPNMSGSDEQDEKFGRERFGIWADPGTGAVITAEMWAKICDPTSRRFGDAMVFGVSAEEDRSAAAIVVATANGVGRTHLELVDTRPGVAWVPARLKELSESRRPRAVVLDSSGAAGSLLPELQRLNSSIVRAPLEVMKKACGGLIDAVRGQGMAQTGMQSTLTTSVLAGKKQTTSGAWVWRRELGSAPLIAATLAAYGWSLKRPTGNGQGRRATVL